jgi:hypothetical protein
MSAENVYCRRYTSADPNVLWTNPKMLACSHPDCAFVDEDPEEILAHYVRQHGRPAPASGDGAPLAQGKLTGGKVSQEDKKAEILLALPVENFQCPFCFARQKSTATRIFGDDGRLLKRVRCMDCAREMEINSMRVTRSPKGFGRWVGEYRGWWHKVDHDLWMKGLRILYTGAAMTQFWDGYAETNARFAERRAAQIDKDGYTKAPSAALAHAKPDDELAAYRKEDGTIDMERLTADAKANLEGTA